MVQPALSWYWADPLGRVSDTQRGTIHTHLLSDQVRVTRSLVGSVLLTVPYSMVGFPFVSASPCPASYTYFCVSDLRPRGLDRTLK